MSSAFLASSSSPQAPKAPSPGTVTGRHPGTPPLPSSSIRAAVIPVLLKGDPSTTGHLHVPLLFRPACSEARRGIPVLSMSIVRRAFRLPASRPPWQTCSPKRKGRGTHGPAFHADCPVPGIPASRRTDDAERVRKKDDGFQVVLQAGLLFISACKGSCACLRPSRISPLHLRSAAIPPRFAVKFVLPSVRCAPLQVR